jgi:hypothetical protein
VSFPEKQASFWENPLYTTSNATNTVSRNQPYALDAKAVQSTKKRGRGTCSLVCPQKHDVQRYGEIKWECSGTLDDGIGQAKLYAERQSALLLLGLSVECINEIEGGAWLDRDGAVVFSKTMPPKSSIRHAIERAKAIAATHSRKRRDQRKVGEKDLLRYMSPDIRAEYLLQRHCRFSAEPSRSLNYFVRVKPLSDEVRSLNHTEIELVGSGCAPTYSLPPIKLNLVDCSSVSARGRLFS